MPQQDSDLPVTITKLKLAPDELLIVSFESSIPDDVLREFYDDIRRSLRDAGVLNPVVVLPCKVQFRTCCELTVEEAEKTIASATVKVQNVVEGE